MSSYTSDARLGLIIISDVSLFFSCHQTPSPKRPSRGWSGLTLSPSSTLWISSLEPELPGGSLCAAIDDYFCPFPLWCQKQSMPFRGTSMSSLCYLLPQACIFPVLTKPLYFSFFFFLKASSICLSLSTIILFLHYSLFSALDEKKMFALYSFLRGWNFGSWCLCNRHFLETCFTNMGLFECNCLKLIKNAICSFLAILFQWWISSS